MPPTPAWETAEVVVVGRGMFGAAAARHLAESGVDVMAIGPDAYDPDNVPAAVDEHAVFSSHNDEARLTRLQDRDEAWAEVTARALNDYAALEDASGIGFHHDVGCLIASRPGGDGRSPDPIADLRERAITHRYFGPGDRTWTRRWPRLEFPETHAIAFEPSPAGYVRPKRLIAAQEACTRRSGGSLVTDTVIGVEPLGASGGFEIVTAAGRRIRSSKVVVAAGAFTNFNGLLEARIPLELKTEVIVLGEVSPTDVAELGSYPTVKYLNDRDQLDAIYMTPAVKYPDGRSCIKLGANIHLDTNPADLDAVQRWFQTATDEIYLEPLQRALQALWPDVVFTSFRTRPCIVAYTPDRFPLITEALPGLVVATGGNGGGAKGSDAWGAMAADLIMHG
ncbi:MAG: NAD(P)/FAD-dependent oxidoreductase [Acidimicrobiales bacterium]